MRHAEHVREVFKENRNLFKRQSAQVMEHFIRDEQGNWSDEYGIVLFVNEKVDQDTLPPEDRIPDEIDGVTVYFDEAPTNYTGHLIERLFQKDPEVQYVSAIKFRYDDVLFGHPDFYMADTDWWGYDPEHWNWYRRGGRGVSLTFYRKVDPNTLPWDGQLPKCLHGVPVTIIEHESN